MESVLEQADEVLVVDNGSPGGSAGEMAIAAGARALRLKRNLGWAAAANAGVRKTSGDVTAFLHDDVVAGNQWLAAASRLLDDPTIGAVAPRVVRQGRFLEVTLKDEPSFNEQSGRQLGREIFRASLGGTDVLELLTGPGIYAPQGGKGGQGGRLARWTSGHGSFYVPLGDANGLVELEINGAQVRPSRVVDLLASAGTYLQLDGRAGDIGAGTPDEDRMESAEERFGLGSAALVTTRDVLHRVGGFCPRYFSGYEDVDWCWRARLTGLRMFFDPVTAVRRRADTPSGDGSNRASQLSEHNRIATLVRNAPFGLAVREVRAVHKHGADDGVVKMPPRLIALSLAEREVLRRRWVVRPREVFERWAGLDVPPVA